MGNRSGFWVSLDSLDGTAHKKTSYFGGSVCCGLLQTMGFDQTKSSLLSLIVCGGSLSRAFLSAPC